MWQSYIHKCNIIRGTWESGPVFIYVATRIHRCTIIRGIWGLWAMSPACWAPVMQPTTGIWQNDGIWMKYVEFDWMMEFEWIMSNLNELCRSWLNDGIWMNYVHICVWVVPHICIYDVTHLYICVGPRKWICDMTHLYICICDMTHLYIWICDMTHLYICIGHPRCTLQLQFEWMMSHICMWVSHICMWVTPHIRIYNVTP